MRRRRSSGLGTFAAGLIGLVVMAVGTYLGFTKSIPFRDHYEVEATFRSANNIKPKSPVRIAGVEVGKVTAVRPVREDATAAVVRMRIEDKGLPLHEDAEFTIRPRIFLEGNFFVDVKPGSPSSPVVEDGEEFPIQQTRTPVQFDQVLTALQYDSRQELQVLLKEYGEALEGGADGYRRSLKYFEPAYRDTAIVNQALLGRRDGDLARYIRTAGTVSAALDRSPEKLKALITDFNRTARAFAVEDVNLTAAIRELPRTLDAGLPALEALNDAFPPTRRLIADLRPGVRSSGPALDASVPLLRQLRGLVGEDELRGLSRDLRRTVPSLASLNEGILPPMRELRRLASCANGVLNPWLGDRVKDPQFPAQGTVREEFGQATVGLGGESRSGDANGQWFRILTVGGQNVFEVAPGSFAATAFPILGALPPKSPRPPLAPTQPCENQQPPDLAAVPGAAPEQRRVSLDTPRAKAWSSYLNDEMVLWLRRQLEREGLDDAMAVEDRVIGAAEAARIAAANRAAKAAERAARTKVQP